MHNLDITQILSHLYQKISHYTIVKGIHKYKLRIFPVEKLHSILFLPRVLPLYDVQIFTIQLPNICCELSALYDLLSPKEKDRTKRFYFDKDANLFIAAHGLLRVILAHYLKVSPREILFTTRSGGKPILSAVLHPFPISFNISHSGETVLIGVSTATEIGVDVETVRPCDNFIEIAENYFHPKEALTISAMPESMRLHKFYEIWTQKEAAVKALGTGLSTPLEQFQVSGSSDFWAKVIFVDQQQDKHTYSRKLYNNSLICGGVSLTLS